MTLSTATEADLASSAADLAVENVFSSYDDQVVLHGVSLNVPAGSCV